MVYESHHLLFQSFCTNLCCSSLWSSFNMSTTHTAKVAFNNVFRYLLGIQERCSISQLFLNNNVDSFYVLLRKSIFNLYKRLKECDNALVSCVLNSFYFYFQSPLFLHWKRQLYNTFWYIFNIVWYNFVWNVYMYIILPCQYLFTIRNKIIGFRCKSQFGFYLHYNFL